MLINDRIVREKTGCRKLAVSMWLFAQCLLFPLVAQGLPTNVVILCSTNNIPTKLPLIRVEAENIDRAALLSKWLPGKSLSDAIDVAIFMHTIKRYVDNTNNANITVDFGPYGYISYKRKQLLELGQAKFLSVGKVIELSDAFIQQHFYDIPIDCTKKAEYFSKGAGLNGWNVVYTRFVSGYELLSSDDYIGDGMIVNIYENGDFEFERIWHMIKENATIDRLRPLDSVISNICSTMSINSSKIYLQNIFVISAMNLYKDSLGSTLFPAYRFQMNGKNYYADCSDGSIIPAFKSAVDFMKRERDNYIPPRDIK